MRMICCGLAAMLVTAAPLWAADDVPDAAAAIKKAIGSYVAAFNGGDAERLAAHWTEQGEYISPQGDTWHGRKAIAELFAEYFKNNKDAKLELTETEVEVQSPSVAIETGLAPGDRAGAGTQLRRDTRRFT